MSTLLDFPTELRERFEPTRRIGGTEKGSIFEARDIALDRAFAVKVLRVGDDGISGGLTRLQREVDAILQLRSPHVIPVYDLIELESDRIALVMEMVEGESLMEVVERDRLGIAQGVILLHQLSNVLAEVHMRGMLHRNISPHGLMLQRLPSGEVFLRMHDFGRVKVEGEEPVLVPLRDPRYAAPEELEGASKIGEAADVFSVGAVAYHLLSGRAPWSGDRAERVVSSRKFPLQPLEEIRPEISEYAGLNELVMGMLELDTDQRISAIADVVDAARSMLKRYQLVPRAKREETNVVKPPALSSLSQFGLDAKSSSIVWVDGIQRIHTEAMVSEVEIDAEITEICAKHGVILGDDQGRVWGQWPEMATIFNCPDGSAVTAIDVIDDLEAIAVGTVAGHVHVGRKLKDSWNWRERSGGRSVDRLALSPDGSLLAVARTQSDLEIVDGDRTHELELPSRRVMSLSWSRDNSILLVLLECQLVVFDRRGVMVYTVTVDPSLIRLEYSTENELMALWVGDEGVETRPFEIDLG